MKEQNVKINPSKSRLPLNLSKFTICSPFNIATSVKLRANNDKQSNQEVRSCTFFNIFEHCSVLKRGR